MIGLRLQRKDITDLSSRWAVYTGACVIGWIGCFPEAWNVEHNLLHHYHLNEVTDPDLVQRNTKFLRNLPVPVVFKYIGVAWFILTWKWFYYAPNTFSQLEFAQYRKKHGTVDPDVEKTYLSTSYNDFLACALSSVAKPLQADFQGVCSLRRLSLCAAGLCV